MEMVLVTVVNISSTATPTNIQIQQIFMEMIQDWNE